MTNEDNNERIKELEEKVKNYESQYGPLIEKRGFHNWKNLFKKPKLQDWIVLFLIIMMLVLAFAYSTETKSCRETLKNLDEKACKICEQSREQLAVDSLNNINAKSIVILEETEMTDVGR